MGRIMATNITWHNGEISRKDRLHVLGQSGVTLWLTGLSGSGKSTIAVALEKKLFDLGHICYRLDGDNIRHGLNSDLGFNEADRSENVRRVAEVSALMADSGLIVASSFISPFIKDRDKVREIHTRDGVPFIEIFIDCPIETLKKRDPKGLYKKAMAGEIKNFTGISQPYEVPHSPDMHLDTSKVNLEECVSLIINFLKEKSYF